MEINEFVERLEALGFVNCGFSHPSNPWIRSYAPPVNLQSTMTSLNIGVTAPNEIGVSAYHVTIQGRDYEEVGSSFGPYILPPDQELLDALQPGNEGFWRWFHTRVVCTMTVRREDGSEVHGVIQADDTTTFATKEVN